MPRTVVASKEVMTSFRCYDNSNANDIKVKTIVFFSYLIQLWWSFSKIIANGVGGISPEKSCRATLMQGLLATLQPF